MREKEKKEENKKRESSIVRNLKRRDRFRYVLVGEGVLIGLLTGVLISLLRLLLIGADGLRGQLVSAGEPLLCAGILIVLAILITVLLELEPEIAGSGIPQVESELQGQKDMCWWKVILYKVIGCTAAIGGGLALGREGPSIQLGAMVGKGFARANHRLLTEERLLITCGAGAGLSAAFGAPLAGAIFSLEELHRNFSAEVLLSTMAASVASDFVAANIVGLEPVFGFDVEHGIPLRYYWTLLILGVVLGAFGILYNRTIAWMQDGFDRIGRGIAEAAGRLLRRRVRSSVTASRVTVFGRRAERFGKLLVVFALSWVMFFCYPDALGSGSYLVMEISDGQFALRALAVLLLIKFIYSTASFGSGSPGGIFLPLLVLGAVTGGLCSNVFGVLFGMDQKYITAFVVVAMAGYFAAIVRAPVTGVILITEMTGNFTNLLPLVLTSLVAYLVAEMCGAEPIYTQLQHRSSGSFAARRSMRLLERKTVIDADIHAGAYMDGRRVMDFGLPMGTLIVSVLRDGMEIIPDGHTILRGGDELEILLRERDIAEVESIVERRCRTIVPEK